MCEYMYINNILHRCTRAESINNLWFATLIQKFAHFNEKKINNYINSEIFMFLYGFSYKMVENHHQI